MLIIKILSINLNQMNKRHIFSVTLVVMVLVIYLSYNYIIEDNYWKQKRLEDACALDEAGRLIEGAEVCAEAQRNR